MKILVIQVLLSSKSTFTDYFPMPKSLDWDKLILLIYLIYMAVDNTFFIILFHIINVYKNKFDTYTGMSAKYETTFSS